jgi:molecular chaperone GrpE
MPDRPAADDLAAQPEGETAPSAAPEMVPAEQVTAALEAAADFKDRLLRTLAEMENLRKRTDRENADARTYAIANFARDVVGAIDNMHRALQTMDDELRGMGDPKVIAMIEGVELTERELLKAVEKHGVKKFSPEGEKFDPNLHQAMYEVQDSNLPPGHVAQVIQAGYMIGDRILRPALVGVTKAAPKSPQADRSDDERD